MKLLRAHARTSWMRGPGRPRKGIEQLVWYASRSSTPDRRVLEKPSYDGEYKADDRNNQGHHDT
jgi:hypothetical protein